MANELSRLGEVLMQGSRDYMNISLANQANERNRARVLEDRASAEAGEEQRFQRGVMTNREERRLAKDEAFQAGVIQALVNEGYLNPADAGSPDAVSAAYTRASEAGLIKRYEALVTQGLLKPSEVGDQAKVNAALEKMGATNLETTGNARAEVTRLRDEGIQVQMDMQALEQRLAEPAQMPSNAQIQARAVQLAKQANPGKDDAAIQPKIQEFMPQAIEELTGQAQQDKLLRDQTAAQERQLLYSRARDLQQRQENLENRFRVSPSAAPSTPSARVAPTTSAAPRQASAQERAEAMTAAIRATNPNPTPVAGSGAPAPAYQNTFNDPEIVAFNERQQAAQLLSQVRPLQASRQSAEEKVRRAQMQIDQLKANPAMLPRNTAQYQTSGNLGPMMGPTPEVGSNARVAELAKLYEEIQMGQKEMSEAEKQLAQYQNSAKRGTTPVVTKTSPFTDPVFAPPAQTPGFQSRLSMAPAM